MKLFLTRKFSAGHKLGNPEFTDVQNRQTYGKCCNVHGHTWKVDITVDGDVDEQTGMLCNFNDLKNMIDEFDHRYINDIVPLPTAENLVMHFMKELKGMALFRWIRVKVWESDSACAMDTWMVD